MSLFTLQFEFLVNGEYSKDESIVHSANSNLNLGSPLHSLVKLSIMHHILKFEL